MVLSLGCMSFVLGRYHLLRCSVVENKVIFLLELHLGLAVLTICPRRVSFQFMPIRFFWSMESLCRRVPGPRVPAVLSGRPRLPDITNSLNEVPTFFCFCTQPEGPPLGLSDCRTRRSHPYNLVHQSVYVRPDLSPGRLVVTGHW